MKPEVKDAVKAIIGTLAILLIIGLAGSLDHADEVVSTLTDEEYHSLHQEVGDHGILTDYYVARAYEQR